MTPTDNAALLTRANARRRQATLAAARDAIERLGREGRRVSFGGAAKAAGVSRAWLYRDPEIRNLIEQLRGTPQTTTRDAHRASADSLRQRLDAARADITRLRAENAALRDQLARHFGGQRTHTHHDLNRQP
jgi:hypothetical protein